MKRTAVVFVGLQIGMIVSTLDGTIVATALPTIARDLGSEHQRAWVISAFQLGQVATMPLYGKLGDLYGRKKLWLFAITTFTVASMLCGSAQTLGQLAAFRALQGIGAGGLGVLAMAVTADIVPARSLGRWLGYQGALFAVASLIGPLMGGLFVDHLSWRWAFFINLPLALIAVAIVSVALRVPYQRIAHAIDYAGAALLTAALVLVVLFASNMHIALGLGVVALTVLFMRVERRAAEPVVPLELFRSSISRVTAGTNFTSGALFASGIFFLPVFFQQVADLTPTQSGLLLVPFMFTTAGATLVAGRMVERTGRYRIWPIVGGVLMTVGVLALATTIDSDTPAAAVAALGAVLGTGVGCAMQTSLLALQNSVAPRDMGAATSSALLARILGSTIGVAVWSGIYEAIRESDGVVDGLRGVYLAAIPVGIVATVLALRLEERPLREDAQFAIPATEV